MSESKQPTMRKKSVTARANLHKWLSSICYQSAAKMIDDCPIVQCKCCLKEGFTKDEIKHTNRCDVKKAFTNLKNI